MKVEASKNLLIGVCLFALGCLRSVPPASPAANEAAASAPAAPSQYLATATGPIFDRARALGQGINLANALEAPSEGEWGVTLREEDFRLVADAGFQHVRIPVRWSAHALESAPFTIDAQFLARVHWAVDRAALAGLRAIVNVQNYDGINQDPTAHAERLTALWAQIAESFRAYPDTLYFELLNEPHDKLTADANNALIPKLLAAIRASNPERAVVIDPADWGNAPGLARLELPAADRNLIPTFHYYDPHDFTHQGAPWEHRENQAPLDWPSPKYSQRAIAATFDQALRWAEQQERPLYLGEFGVYQAADMGARVRWTRAVVEEARARHLPYAYWELRSGFGAYDMEKAEWRQPLLDALLPERAATPGAS